MSDEPIRLGDLDHLRPAIQTSADSEPVCPKPAYHASCQEFPDADGFCVFCRPEPEPDELAQVGKDSLHAFLEWFETNIGTTSASRKLDCIKAWNAARKYSRQHEPVSSASAPVTEIDYRALLLQFVASLTLADHMGDVGTDVNMVLERIGVEIEWEDWPELGRALGRMGVTTLYGTPLGD